MDWRCVGYWHCDFVPYQGIYWHDYTYQGTVGTTGTDLILDNNALATSQTINVTVFTFTDRDA